MADHDSQDRKEQRRAQDKDQDLRKMDADGSDPEKDGKGPTGTPPHRADTHWDTAAKAATGEPLPAAGTGGSDPDVPDKAGLETVAGGRKPEKGDSGTRSGAKPSKD